MSGNSSSGPRPQPPPSLSAGDAERLDTLAGDELTRRREGAAAAVDRAFEHIPRLLRGPVRRLLGA